MTAAVSAQGNQRRYDPDKTQSAAGAVAAFTKAEAKRTKTSPLHTGYLSTFSRPVRASPLGMALAILLVEGEVGPPGLPQIIIIKNIKI